jgi:hypothetical protein
VRIVGIDIFRRGGNNLKNGWHEGKSLGNPNVPSDVIIDGSVVSMSGEIIVTYYFTGLNWFKVCDWTGSKPERSSYAEVYKHRGTQ